MKADIIACYPRGIIGKIISLITKCEISHVALMIDDEFLIESDWVGVRARKIKELKESYILLRYENLTNIQKNKIIEFVRNSVDTHYDYKLIIGLGLKKIFNLDIKKFNNVNKYICTELILEAYKSIGINLVDKHDKLYPEDIIKSRLLKIINKY